MIWQDYRKLYANALKTYSPKFKKELQKQVDTYCRTQNLNAISDKALKKTIQRLHMAMGVKMAQIVQKSVKRSVKGIYEALETKSAETDLFAYVILQYLERQGLNQLAADITDTTKEQIRRFLIQASEKNYTMQETIALLRVSGITDYRAELIARTETGRAANIGSMVGTASTGLVTMKEWISARDNRTRRIPRDQFDHLHMDGVKIPFDDKFKLQNKKGGFDLMLHPCDSSGSAADVCNCRCTLGYEAQRDSKGKLMTLQNNPPKGDVGYIWNLLTNYALMEVTTLVSEALTD
ncbi:MAG: hypothetical protein EBY16_08625 [Gammaproteobacteria bacterium]|jgi:hypothetical protein|nr:hypothetical protein [Gammaproteobacteria bacterium]